MRRMLAASIVVLASLIPTNVAAQQGLPLRTVFESDSLIVGWPTVSPDGKWLVFVRTLSNQESRLMIQPVAGGTPRELFAAKGAHQDPTFAAQGDRLVFTSTLPRRGPSDAQLYVVGASFDTRTGTLTSTPRQIALDPLRSGARTRPAVSPDGRSLAYVAHPGNQLRVVPITGGNARTLVEPSTNNFVNAPGWLAWSADSRSLSYHVRSGEFSTRLRIAVDGGKPSTIARVEGGMGPVSPDGRHYFTIEGRVPATMRVFSIDGREVASARVPRMNHQRFSPDGRYILGRSDNTLSTLKVVPVSGGASRAIGRGQGYEWGVGWSADGREVHVSEEEAQGQWLRIIGIDGSTKSRTKLPEGNQFMGVSDGQMIFREGPAGRSTGWKLVAQRLSDGTRTVLAEDVHGYGCCAVTPAGGMYYGFAGDEFHYLKVRGDRLEIHAMRLGSPSRALAEVPRRLIGTANLAVAGDRVAYTDVSGDSLHVRLVNRRGAPVITLASMPKVPAIGEIAFSHDGRQLMFYTTDAGQPMTVLRLDEAGKVVGAPQRIMPPFEYYYETFWLRDGSGLTMIAQPRGAPEAEVAVMKFADPQNPILVSKGDPGSKWGHMLSHDGQYIIYPAERERGSMIRMLDFSAILKQATASK